MEHPKQLIVRTHIPSRDNPEAHVLHATGTEPLEVGIITTNQEKLLYTLARKVFSIGYLAIDTQLSRQDIYDSQRKAIVNVSDLRTKPVDRSQMQLAEGYYWSDRPQT